jgi:hypothetical protein
MFEHTYDGSFRVVEQLPEPVEALLQHAAVHVHPLLEVLERPRAEAAHARPPVPGARSASLRQQLPVLNRRLAYATRH